jgi:O-methyltransferase involved in polyketide biosynthesis
MIMPEIKAQKQNSVVETLFITLYIRAMESQRPDALLKDEKAVALVSQIDYDFSRIKQVRMDEDDKLTIILRNREFDRYARDFLARYPDAVVVHLGCGLDTRFERVDNGQVEWYDLDIAEVIALRQKYLGGEGGRYHHLACSAFDRAWFERVKDQGQHFLFIAEGVLMYFPEAQVKALILALRDLFPGGEFVFDAFSPYLVRMNNLRFKFTHYGAMYHWGLKHGQAVEGWAPGICLLGEWSYFDRSEPRLEHIRWMRHIPFLARVLTVYHFRLGNEA